MCPHHHSHHHNVRCKKRHRSIFLKLFVTLIGTMLLVQLVVGGVFGLLFGKQSLRPIQKNIKHYASFIVEQVGSPPDTVLARKLAKEYDMEIRYEREEEFWSSHPKISLAMRDKRIRKARGPGGPTSAWRRYTIVDLDDGSRFYIRWGVSAFFDFHRQLLFGILAIVSLIFVGTHIYIRKILHPLKNLRHGVNEISAGNLDIEIPVEHDDELGCLTEAFNDMARQIKEMLHSRDQLLLDVSHELRSPLTRMKVALEMIPDSDRKESVYSDIVELETMITEILESERLGNGHSKLNLFDTNLADLLRSIAWEYQEGHPGIQYENLPKKHMLKIDAERFRIVVNNLLQNAVKYARPESRATSISILQKETTEVIICDDGIGIPEAELPYLFEPFYRVDRSRSKATGGYGLGLGLCKKIMEAHGGDIQIVNNEGPGITVTLVFQD